MKSTINEKPPVAPKEPQRRSRARSAMIDATKRLLSKSSISGFLIDDVVREADVARGTFYNHFSNLDDLVLHTLNTVQEELFVRIEAVSMESSDPAHTLALAVATVMSYGYFNQANARVLLYNGPGVADPLAPRNELLITNLNRGIELGVFKFENSNAIVVAILGICEVGLARMQDLHHEFTAVRDLTHGLCIMALRCAGVNSRSVERIARVAMTTCFDTSFKAPKTANNGTYPKRSP